VEQSAQCDELKEALHQLEAKVQAAEARRHLLIARNSQAKAKVAMRETVAGARDVSALAQFERMESKIEEQELRADAYVELDGASLDATFWHLEQQDGVHG